MSMGPDFSGGDVPQRSFSERLVGAIRLDATVYEEVEHTPEAMGQAATVVALAVVAQVFGTQDDTGLAGGALVLVGLLAGFMSWFVGTGIIWLVGVRLMNHTSDYAELLRTLGFASAPHVLYVFGALPLGMGAPLLTLAVSVLGLCAWVIAARQALDVTTGRAVVICLLGVFVQTLTLTFLVLAAAGMLAAA